MEELYPIWNKRYPYFKPEEVLSPDCLALFYRGIITINLDFLDMVQGFRKYLDKPFIINNLEHRFRGTRSPKESMTLGGRPFHPMGVAVDLTVKGLAPEIVAFEAKKFGFRGIGLYDTFTHIDMRPVLVGSKNYFFWDKRT